MSRFITNSKKSASWSRSLLRAYVWASHITYQSLVSIAVVLIRKREIILDISNRGNSIQGNGYKLVGRATGEKAGSYSDPMRLHSTEAAGTTSTSASAAELEPRDCSCCHWQTNKMATSSCLLITLEYPRQQSNQNPHVIGVKRNAAVRLWRVAQSLICRRRNLSSI